MPIVYPKRTKKKTTTRVICLVDCLLLLAQYLVLLCSHLKNLGNYKVKIMHDQSKIERIFIMHVTLNLDNI